MELIPALYIRLRLLTIGICSYVYCLMSTLDSRHAFTGPSAAGTLPSSLQVSIHKVNCPAREGALGHSVSRKGMSAI